MDIYVILIIFFLLVFIGALIVFVYLKNDERRLKEVDDAKLSRLGKKYTKAEYEETMSNMFFEILTSLENEDYNNLRDIVSDQEYNKMLAEKKEEKDKDIVNKVTNIKKIISKLIDFKIINDLEVAKVIIVYSCSEFALGKREVPNEKGKNEIKQVVVSGDENKVIYHEYILTFVRNRTDNEEIKCPTCGYDNHLLTKSKCIGCDTLIMPKTMHWVYTGKVDTYTDQGNNI